MSSSAAALATTHFSQAMPSALSKPLSRPVSKSLAMGNWADGAEIVRPADLLATLGVVTTFSRNAEIYGEDAPADHIYIMLSGTARVCKLLGDGRRQIENFCLSGDVFGWEMLPRHRFSAEAVSECKVVRIKRSILFARAADDAELAHALWSVTATELGRTQNHLLVLGRKTAQERVATFLLDLAERLSAQAGRAGGRCGAVEVQLPMSRQDIADYLGLTIETVSRTLTHLEDVEAIALPSSRRVLLRNRAALQGLNS
ncbi:helix-turn-helix domain-containing protein [Xanthobacter sp. TB0139]|uniref:helix-turn-helix domain-containing protein n=1 Tax=Xanthobacter sp. TB0139 TaxID=3459178 RepID=UPI00403A79F9